MGKTTHGLTKHELYHTWQSMIQRCYNKNNESYKFYGAIGVIVCDEWLNSSSAFLEWALNNGWQKGLHLDKDIKAKEMSVNPLLYSPERCQFVTPKANANTRRNSRLITHNGKTKNLSQWAEDMGGDVRILHTRLNVLGWPIERTLNTPLRKCL